MLLCGALLGLALLAGCVDPSVIQEKTRVFETRLLEGIQDGHTTRQEVLLRLGVPTATFEGGTDLLL
jgi:outer membrane protein assembly factor BamE (lipoprotein component of BamABCDE complex)